MGGYPPPSCCRLQGGEAGTGCSLLERALLGSGRLLALWKANRQLAYHRHRPTREEHKQTRVPARPPAVVCVCCV